MRDALTAVISWECSTSCQSTMVVFTMRAADESTIIGPKWTSGARRLAQAQL